MGARHYSAGPTPLVLFMGHDAAFPFLNFLLSKQLAVVENTINEGENNESVNCPSTD